MEYNSVEHIFYLNGHYIDSIKAIEAVNIGVTFALDKSASPQIPLDLGYVEKDGKQIINYALNQTAVVGYDKMHLGGRFHNLINSYFRMPLGGFWDRSNATIWNDTARLGYYDSLNPTDFHVSEMNYDILNTYFNAGYIDMVFEGLKASYGDVDFTFAILAYATQKTGAELTKVLKYINYI